MLKTLKKLLFSKNNKVEKITNNYDLILKLTDIAYNDKVEKIFYNPVNKIFMMNMYTNDLNDLVNNLFTPVMERSLNAVNVHSYFFNSKADISQILSRVLNILPNIEKLNVVIEHDLYELCSSFEYLLSLEN